MITYELEPLSSILLTHPSLSTIKLFSTIAPVLPNKSIIELPVPEYDELLFEFKLTIFCKANGVALGVGVGVGVGVDVGAGPKITVG